MENKLQMILRSLDKDFIIWLNQQIINEDPSSTFGLVNPDNIDGAIYSAIFDLEENHSISRSLAVLIHHIAIGHPFAIRELLMHYYYQYFRNYMRKTFYLMQN
jgi:hypothetical protein